MPTTAPPTTDQILHKPADVHRRLGISLSYLYDLHNAGKITFVKIGRSTFITDAELQRFVASLDQK